MKYIRTKSNHIYKTLEDFMQTDLPPTKLRVENVKKGWHVIIYKSQIIKQADTIEELCDMFVFRAGEYVIIDQDNDKCFRSNWKCYDTIYGAIWCEWGLKYVARMNSEGVLELL